jgi:hypothetical protein
MTTKKDTKETQENTQANNENTESNQKKAESIEKVSKALEEYNRQKEKSLDQKRREIQYNADLARMQNDQMELQDQLAKAQNLLLEAREKAKDMDGEQKEAAEAEAASYENLVKSIAKSMGMTEKQTKAVLDSKEAMKGNTDSTKRYGKAADNVFGSLTKHAAFLFGDSKSGLVGGMFEFAASMNQAEKGQGTLSKSFFKFVNLTSIATAMINNIVESTVGMVKQFDDAAASFAAATGTGDQFTGTLLEMRQEGNAMGVTFENSSKALQSLVENQVGFLGASKAAQKEMATQVALMDRIGISTDVSAEMMNVFTINMGKSQGQAVQMTKALASMGSVLGNSQKFLQGFQESLKDLAVYGKGAVDIFSNMAAAARAAGVEVGTLTGLASRFDTFADSAETVGKLNAMLGSQLSSTEMLLMTEDQRIETLVQQVQISGESFAQMDRFKQKAIAAAAGITDMNEAQRIFGMNMGDYKKYQKDMERQAKIQDNFNKAIDATIPLTEKFSQFMAEFAIFVQPMAEFIGMVLDFMTGLISSLPEGIKGILGFAAGAFLVMKAFSGVSVITGAVTALSGAAVGAGTSLGAITAASTPASAGMRSLGAAALQGAGGMAAFAIPFIGIGLTIAGVVLSFGYLVGQFVELAKVGPEAVGVLFQLGATLAAVGGLGLLGAGGISVSMGALVSGLAAMRLAIGDETSTVSNALENLALIATGTSAKAMGGATATITSELRGAVEAAMTTKLEIELKINEGKFNDIIEDVVGNYIDSSTGKRKVIKVARAT